ncbi:hypothetical protein BOTBODRAFT_107909, partial [Botryobasidium botryosum FD-172 SS1]
RYSILPALSLDGVLHFDIIECAYKSYLFNSFIDTLLDNVNLFPAPNSIIVMDNASIHKSIELQEMVEAWFAWICANRDFVCGELTGKLTCDLYSMLWEAVFTSITAEKAQGWY